MDACSGQASDNELESTATKTSKSTFCCCGLWRLQGQNIVFLVFVAAISCSHPQKPKRRGTQKRKGRVVENPRPKSSNLLKILPKPSKTSPNLPKILPNSVPNPTKSKEIESAATKTRKVETKLSWINVRHPLGRHFGRPRPPKRGPRGSRNLQNGAKNAKKTMFKNKSFSDSIF